MRRFTRLTNGFSKTLDDHRHATAPHYMFYSFVRTHKTPRCAPAMDAGVTRRLWEISGILIRTSEMPKIRTAPLPPNEICCKRGAVLIDCAAHLAQLAPSPSSSAGASVLLRPAAHIAAVAEEGIQPRNGT
jgi:hypothetical protein